MNNNETVDAGKRFTIIMVPIAILIVVLIINFGKESGCFDSTPKSIEEMTAQQEINDCLNRSDTYHKCHWSTTEDMCVCKER